jgi:hypothetical protein
VIIAISSINNPDPRFSAPASRPPTPGPAS